MMTAYQPPAGHPGMPPHGHPGMTPGQPMNPAQMQQMGHPGASGPGAPHMTQPGAMMGMQPGGNGMSGGGGMGGQHPGGQMGGMPGQMGGQSMAGGAPNAQALSHMNPQAMMHQQQQQQQQQMQQQMQNNPQMQQMQQQHQAALIRRQQIAQMQANGMAGMPQGGMQGMTPQQMQQMQQLQQNHPGIHGGVQLPPHMQQQQMRLQQQQQQQAHQNHQNQQMQQHLAMQQANSQHSNQGGQSGPPSQQGGQPQQAGQMRPQSRMANPNEQAQQTPQQAQAQAPPQQGQPNQQPPGQQPNQPQQGQQPNMNPQQMQALAQQRQRMQMQQMQQRQAQQQMAQAQQAQSGQMILRFVLLADQLSQFNASNGKEISNWQGFVDRHFAPEGRLVHTFDWDDKSTQGPMRQFEVLRPTIARYFQMYFDSGADSIRLHAENAREIPPQQGGQHRVWFPSAQFTVSYSNGARLEMHGRVNVTFTPGQEVEALELTTTRTEEVVARSEIERLLSTWSPTMGNKQSPKMTKKNLPKAQQKLQSQFEGLTIDHFPRTPKGQMGIMRVQQFLELGEIMNVMSELFNYASEKQLRPEQAMEQLVQQYEQNPQQQQQGGNPQINFPNGMQPEARTPSMGNMQIPNAQFSSPNISNLSLPMQNGMPMNGSPQITSNPGLQPGMMQPNSHTPSPRQTNRAAPPMMPQHSQQGTNSSGPSANTSPSVNNKRRRSAVKLEGDEGGGEPGPGNRVKPSPRMTKKAKPGGA